jgi:glutathione S-transferase
MTKPTIYHIPVCPFSQRVEMLLELKGLTDSINFVTVDITKPRDPELLKKTRGSTALPMMELEAGEVIKESLVILRYVEERYGDIPVAQTDPYKRSIERFVMSRQGDFAMSGYKYVMNTDRSKTDALREAHLAEYRWLDAELSHFNPTGPFLFDDIGLAECVYTPMFMRFWFLDYYEGFTLPDTDDYARVRQWRDACMRHPAAQQVTHDEIVTLYYDYAVGAGNGALPEGRTRSSFVFDPDWRDRPMPPKDKYDRVATDAELGLV